MNLNRILFFVFVCISSACQRDEAMVAAIPISPPSDIDNRILPFYENFISEASLRGLDISDEVYDVSAEIIEISEDHIAGQCNFTRLQSSNHIIIDEEFFNNASSLFNEFIIFHELGHCVLYRDHLETSFNNGVCTSIMRSGTENCRDNYAPVTREQYLDELFSVMDEI